MLRDHGAARLEHASMERIARGRLTHIWSSPENRDGGSVCGERTLMRGGITAKSHPADDNQTRRGCPEAEVAGHATAVGTRSARANDRHRLGVVDPRHQVAVAKAEEPWRRQVAEILDA